MLTTGCFFHAIANKDGVLTLAISNLPAEARRSMVVCNWRRVAVFRVLCDTLNMFLGWSERKRWKSAFLSTGGEIGSDDEICLQIIVWVTLLNVWLFWRGRGVLHFVLSPPCFCNEARHCSARDHCSMDPSHASTRDGTQRAPPR